MNLKEYIQHNKGEIDDREVSFEVDFKFSERLKKELHQPKKGRIIYLKNVAIAASIALLFTIGNVVVTSFNKQKDKTQLLANLNNDSAGTRLEGVYHFDEKYKNEDAQIINTLISILHDDSNANVKIATIDALLKFTDNEIVRTGFITALGNEQAPLVQIKLIKSLSLLRENRAQKPLEDIMGNQETLPIVLSNASLAMAKINNNN